MASYYVVTVSGRIATGLLPSETSAQAVLERMKATGKKGLRVRKVST